MVTYMAWKRYRHKKRSTIASAVRKAGKAARYVGRYFGKPGRLVGDAINAGARFFTRRTPAEKFHKRLYNSGITGRLTTGTQGGSTSYFNVSKHKNFNKAIMKNLTARQTIEASYPMIVESGVGAQAASSYYFFDQRPISQIFQFAQQNLPTGSQWNNSSKVLLESVVGSIEFVNSSTAPSHLKLWDLVSRKDINMNGPGVPSSAFPENAWNNGEISQGDSAGLSNIMSYPTRSEQFNTVWKILQGKQMVLSPGECHKHAFKISVNRWMNNYDAVNYVRWAGLTHAVMVATYGTPADASGATGMDSPYDASGAFVGSSLVSTTSSQINAVLRLRYTYRVLLANTAKINVVDNIPSLSDLEVVNLEGDKIAATTT